MPAHDGGRLNEHQRGRPSRPHGGERDPEQSTSFTKTRSRARAFEGSELLPEGDILKNELVVPTAGDRERATEQQNQVQHALDSAVPDRMRSTATAVLGFGEGQSSSAAGSIE